MSFSSKDILKENISYHYIYHDTQVCDRSYDDGICSNFKSVGKEPMKSNLGLTSVLGIDTYFVLALTTTLHLAGTTVPIQIWSYFYSELEDHNPRLQCLIIIQIQISWLLKINWLNCKSRYSWTKQTENACVEFCRQQKLFHSKPAGLTDLEARYLQQWNVETELISPTISLHVKGRLRMTINWLLKLQQRYEPSRHPFSPTVS